MRAMTNYRFHIAVAVSPLVAVMPFLGILLLYSTGPFPLGVVALIIGIATPFSYLGLFVFGVPLFLLLRTHNRISMPPFLFVGAVGGIAVYTVFALLMSALLETQYQFEIVHVLWGSCLGFGVAVVFCLIAGITSASSRR